MRENVWQPRSPPRQLLSLSAGEEYASITQLYPSAGIRELPPHHSQTYAAADPPAHVLTDLREKLSPFYSDIGRPSIDPELMLRMLNGG